MNTDDINQDLINDTKEVLNLFFEYDRMKNINENSYFFKYLNHIQLISFILPYLNLKDIINLRSSCSEINKSINS